MNARHTVRAARTTIRRGAPLDPGTALRLRWRSRYAHRTARAVVIPAVWQDIPPAVALGMAFTADPACTVCHGTGQVEVPDQGGESASWEQCHCRRRVEN